MQLYLFAYGSLMNPKSLKKTLPKSRVTSRAALTGYKRITNAPVNGYAYMNIAPSESAAVEGVLIPITADELEMFNVREEGYRRVDVSDGLMPQPEGKTFAFIAPETPFPGLKVPRSYLNTCLAGVPEESRAQWLEETIMPFGVEEDLSNPVYEFASLD